MGKVKLGSFKYGRMKFTDVLCRWRDRRVPLSPVTPVKTQPNVYKLSLNSDSDDSGRTASTVATTPLSWRRHCAQQGKLQSLLDMPLFEQSLRLFLDLTSDEESTFEESTLC